MEYLFTARKYWAYTKKEKQVMPRIEAKINEAAIDFLTRWLPPRAFDAIEVAVQKIVLDLERYIKTVTYPESGLHRRTGHLLRSIRAQRVRREPRSVVGVVLAGQRLPYARMQEYGGTVTPVRAQYLTIPLDAAKTAAGVARFTARGAEDAGYKTFIRNHIIFGVKQDEGQAVARSGGRVAFRTKHVPPVPLFYLAPSADIPERRYMRSGLEAFQKRIVDDIAHAVNVAVKDIPKEP